MLVRVVTIHVRPEKMDECIKIFRERNAPSIASQPGFHHGHWWVDRTKGWRRR
jgi:heme-degrading monooxygenase HmoA